MSVISEKKKAYLKHSRSGGGYKIPMKTRKTISTTEIFPLWPPFLSAKKSSALEQGGVCSLFFPVFGVNHFLNNEQEPETNRHILSLNFSKFQLGQDHEKGGLSLRGAAVMTETAMTAETAKTVKNYRGCLIVLYFVGQAKRG